MHWPCTTGNRSNESSASILHLAEHWVLCKIMDEWRSCDWVASRVAAKGRCQVKAEAVHMELLNPPAYQTGRAS